MPENDPNYFMCEKFKCTMLKSRCVERRNLVMARAGKFKASWDDLVVQNGYYVCLKCDQGKTV